LQRSLTYVREHYTEHLTLDAVARVSGFAPNYFSQLFKRREHVSFERYVRRLRVERAKHLLASTAFPLRRISELTGFSHHSYFTTVFKADTGVTPVAFRRTASPYPKRAKRGPAT
jgi:YesN/AraC family two-component response regulator